MVGRLSRWAGLALAGMSLAACATPGGPAHVSTMSPSAGGAARGTMRPYQVNGVWYTPREDPGYDEVGIASWYGDEFHNRRTADGELFDMDRPSAAHRTLPLPSLVEVTNLDNGRRIRVRLNDRGPFVRGRIIDLSRQAARDLGFYGKGVARVRVRYLGPAEPAPPHAGVRYAAARSASQSATPAGAWRIQAGAFADRGNAERAARRLSEAGEASIEASAGGETTLYRVIVAGRGQSAEILLARVAAAGFPDAKVLGPL